MIKSLTVFFVVLVIGVGAFLIFKNSKMSQFQPVSHPLISVDSPRANESISSPLTVSGEARGNWYFEADFPIELLDGNGNVITMGIATAQGDWMTTEFVPFTSTLIFTNPNTATGTLVLHKDNPSGLPEHDDEIRIPVRFASSALELRTVSLYFYNEFEDQDSEGNIMCSSAGLEAVERSIPLTNTPIQDAVKMLLKGELSSLERVRGLSTEFPLIGFELLAASLNEGVLTLTFQDTENKTTGGACRTGVLWAQIEATAKQFEGVEEVRFSPEELFQP